MFEFIDLFLHDMGTFVFTIFVVGLITLGIIASTDLH